MIIDLVQRLEAKQEQATLLLRGQAEQKNLETTQKQAISLQEACLEFEHRYRLLASRLSKTIHQECHNKIMALLMDVQATNQQFPKILNQKQGLVKHGATLTSITNLIHQAWTIMLDQRLAPYIKLLHLVSALPEIQEQTTNLQHLRDRLEQAKKTLPSSQDILFQVDKDLDEFAQRLSDLSNLSDELQIFLQKVIDGTATIADLTPEILMWCQDQRHAHAFKIVFSTQRRNLP